MLLGWWSLVRLARGHVCRLAFGSGPEIAVKWVVVDV